MSDSIVNAGPVSERFLHLGIEDFDTACRYVKDLPYGRTSSPSSYELVLTERKGTCSSKHALLAALGKELGLSVRLMVGIYHMDEDNTPGVGRVLSVNGLISIPEAHCYLVVGDERRDFTKMEASSSLQIVHEEEITPEQIGEYKRQLHQRFLCTHFGAQDFLRIWKVREECIQALASGEQQQS